MNYIQIILLLSILVVVLLLVDIYRRSDRKKQKLHLNYLEIFKKDNENFKDDDEYSDSQQINSKNNISPSKDNIKKHYQSLAEGYALVSIIAPEGYAFNGMDLNKLFEGLSLKLNASGIYDFLTEDNDVLYSILPDDDKTFDCKNISDIDVEKLFLVMSLTKLKTLDYDLQASFDFFIRKSKEISRKLGSALFNENNTEYSEEDSMIYKTVITEIENS